ncbi:AbrB/MazE/SpoVT family DNA-binding domain-containing protein [Dactylosporangium sp. CA-139066]|uniref:AbrB/MazE/SpoVT family DNA-binding domain-containing protein n=1 Tax=Dactylosporangium sp. CA-139066 TaxID=3239930 RepID=UPI003D8B6A9B
MTRPIAPLILSSAGSEPQRPLARPPLPLATLPEGRRRSWQYAVSTIDNRGRVAETSVVRALGWAAGTRLHVREQGRLIVAVLDEQGVFQISQTGHLLIPVAVRRWADLRPGDRVLLAGDPDRKLIVVHPPEAIDAMVEQLHAIRLGDPL